MFIRLALSLVFSAALFAQHTIKVEFQSAKLPKDVALKIDLSLMFTLFTLSESSALKTNGALQVFHNPKTVLEQTSTNSANWIIAYDDDGNPLVEGSPQSMAFNFPKPVSMPSKGSHTVSIKFIGKLQQIENGEIISTQEINERGKIFVSGINIKELRYNEDASYVFYLYPLEDGKQETTWRYALLFDWQYRDLLEGKYTIKEPVRRSGTINSPIT
jgi:hypothetical protein